MNIGKRTKRRSHLLEKFECPVKSLHDPRENRFSAYDRFVTSSYIDLHSHSLASDGTMSPGDVVQLAHQSGLSAIALTDHDTTAGLAEASEIACKIGIDFLHGIEISCSYPRPGTMHLLGYGIDPDAPKLQSTLKQLIEERDTRNAKVVRLLNDQGIRISLDRVIELAKGGVVGRPHIAHALAEIGAVTSTAQAFSKYLGQNGSAYIDKERLTPRQAIELIHSAGGIISLAHPIQLRKQNRAQLRNEIKNLADMGLDAIEVIHSDHRESVVVMLDEWADRFGLLKTGGSDFHGSNKLHIKLGFAQSRRRIPRSYFDAIVARLRKRHLSRDVLNPSASESIVINSHC